MQSRVRISRWFFGLSITGVGMALGSSAWAQTAATNAASSASSGDTTLEEIIVTAERRTENLEKTPVSATVLSGEVLAQQNKSDINEIVQDVPGVQLQEGVGGYVINIRGVTNNAGSVADQVASLYLDGVYSSQLPVEDRSPFFDLNRVEVLRGPQGTLWGGNALGGVVSLISNDPQLNHYSADLTAAAANYDGLSEQAVVNAPIGSDIAIRAVIASEDRRGYYGNGQDDSVYNAGRLKVMYQPSDAFKLVLTAMQTKVGGEGVGTINSPYPASLTSQSNPWANATPVVFNGTLITPTSPEKDNSFRGDLEWNLGLGTLTFLPAYTTITQNIVTSPGVLVDLNHTRENGELRLDSNANSPIKWTVGAYYQHFETPLHVDVAVAGVHMANDVRSTQGAGFGQVTVPVTSAFRLTGGIRYTHESNSDFDSFTPPGAPFSLTHPGSEADSATTWKGGFETDLTSDSMLYANVSTGFRSGGIVDGADNPPALVPPGAELPNFQPEKLTAYALGSKNEFLNRSAELNGELFYYDYQNYQVESGNALTGQTFEANAQGVKSYGGEIESRWRPTPTDTLDASVAYLHAIFGTQTGGPGSTADPAAVIYVVNGSNVDHSPHWTLHLGYEHRWNIGSAGSLAASADTNYVTSETVYFGANCHAPGVPCVSPAHHITNAQLAWDSANGRWNTTAYIRNIEDYPVITGVTLASQNFGQETYNVGPPLTFGLSLSLKLDVTD